MIDKTTREALENSFEAIKLRLIRSINYLIIHCSASDFGCRKLIDKWHKERGFREIGYHYLILNGQLSSPVKVGIGDKDFDGFLELGRSVFEEGAGVKGHNRDAIHICLIGNPRYIAKDPYPWFTNAQVETLLEFVKIYLRIFQNSVLSIRGHYEFDPHKICPGFDINWIRSSCEGSYRV